MAAAPQDACWDLAEIAERFKKENAQNPHPGGMILAGERRCRLPKGGDDVIREYSSCMAIVLPVMRPGRSGIHQIGLAMKRRSHLTLAVKTFLAYLPFREETESGQ